MINIVFHHKRVCQETVRGDCHAAKSQSTRWIHASGHKVCGSQVFFTERGGSYILQCNPLLASFRTSRVFNPSSLFNLSLYDVTQKEHKKTQPAFILVCFSSLDLSPSPLPEIASKSEYLQCFCSVNGFMLSSRHEKGSVLALILCLYWAGGDFKPSSIFGVYSKLSDLRVIYWCSISDVYREALLSLVQVKNSHKILPLCLTSLVLKLCPAQKDTKWPYCHWEASKTGIQRGRNPISPFRLFG